MADLERFFDETPTLGHLRDFARSRRTSPWGTFGVALVRTVCAIEPHVVIPPLTGGHASLNLFLALVAPSGGGKGAAEAAGRDAIDHIIADEAEPLYSPTVGTAEGIGRVYWSWNGKADDDGNVIGWQQRRTRALFRAAEVDTLAAVSGRTGSALLPRLRDAWLGDDLSFAYADASKTPPVTPHSYRLGLMVGVQPRKAGPILNDSDGGTPQRFLWLPMTDPAAPEVRPPEPEPLQWRRKELTRHLAGTDPRTRLQSVKVCDTARAAVDAAALVRLTEPGRGDNLDGHALMARLKVAVALGALHGEPVVTDQWWRLAGTVMAVSDQTRAGVVAEMRSAEQERNTARGTAEGQRTVAAREVVERDTVRRVSRRVLSLLDRNGTGPMQHSDLRRAIAGRDRAVFDVAIENLLSADQVIAQKDGDGTTYRRVS